MTLVVGIIASVFSAMVVTRMIFSWALKFNLLQRISMLHLISGEGINFMGRRFLWISISLTVAVVSMIGFGPAVSSNLGIDFEGGDLLMLKPGKPVEVAEVLKHIEDLKINDVVVQKETDPSSKTEFISIRSPIDTGDKIEAALFKSMPDVGFTEHKKDKVGKIVGGELAKSSLIALGLGMLGIFLYVTMRFEASFAVGALVALLHDVIITVGVFSIFGREAFAHHGRRDPDHRRLFDQ
ncbi:MAG: hypothetical protein WDN28_24265 [Chthoniobacter sp.]